MEPRRANFSLAGAGATLIGFTAASAAAGALVGWALDSIGIGVLVGVALGIPLAIGAVYRRYRGAFL